MTDRLLFWPGTTTAAFLNAVSTVTVSHCFAPLTISFWWSWTELQIAACQIPGLCHLKVISPDFFLFSTGLNAIFFLQTVLIMRRQLILASIWEVKDRVMFHPELCGKNEITGTLRCQSVTSQAPLSARNSDFCALDSNNASLTVWNIFPPCTDDHNGFLSELQTRDWPQLLHEPKASNHPIYARWNA